MLPRRCPSFIARFSALALGKKVKYLFLFIIAVYLVVFFSLYTVILRYNVKEYALENNLSTLTTIGHTLQGDIQKFNDMSLLIMSHDAIVQYLHIASAPETRDSQKAISALYDLMAVFTRVSSVYVFDLHANYISATRSVTQVNPALLQQPSWNVEINKNAGANVLMADGDGMFQLKSGGRLITLFRVINDLNTQRPIGYLAINLPIEILENSYASFNKNQNQFGYYYKDTSLLAGNISEEGYEDLWKHRETYYPQVSGSWGNEKITSIYPIEGFPLWLIAVENFYPGEMIPTELLILLLSILLLTLLAMALISAFISFYITKPLNSLVTSMNAVAQTGWLRRLSLPLPDDEIGRLKDRYNAMLIEINRLILELLDKEKAARQAEIAVLQEQVKPHFLYNTLETISFMAAESQVWHICQAIKTLENFYVNFLSSGDQEIPLMKEIQITKDYLSLQKLRYDNSFEDSYEVDPQLENILVPKLILQPLVENSLYHGVRLKGEKGLIRIRATKKDQLLLLEIYDNGVGMSPEVIESLLNQQHEKSFGFPGTIRRIRYFSGNEDVFSVESQVGCFSRVCLTLPLTPIKPTPIQLADQTVEEE